MFAMVARVHNYRRLTSWNVYGIAMFEKIITLKSKVYGGYITSLHVFWRLHNTIIFLEEEKTGCSGCKRLSWFLSDDQDHVYGYPKNLLVIPYNSEGLDVLFSWPRLLVLLFHSCVVAYMVIVLFICILRLWCSALLRLVIVVLECFSCFLQHMKSLCSLDLAWTL